MRNEDWLTCNANGYKLRAEITIRRKTAGIWILVLEVPSHNAFLSREKVALYITNVLDLFEQNSLICRA